MKKEQFFVPLNCSFLKIDPKLFFFIKKEQFFSNCTHQPLNYGGRAPKGYGGRAPKGYDGRAPKG